MGEVSILIIDDDKDSQRALRQILDSEGWRVRVVPLARQGLADLASGEWTLLLVNVSLTDLSGPHFKTLRELAQAEVEPASPARKRVRVLFLVPELAAKEIQPVLENAGLPYTLKPLHLHDFLEKVSDLLLEARAIPAPIRQIRGGPASEERRQKERRSGRDRRMSEMFASREDYKMTEEEIAEFEQREVEERKRKKKEKEGEHLYPP